MLHSKTNHSTNTLQVHSISLPHAAIQQVCKSLILVIPKSKRLQAILNQNHRDVIPLATKTTPILLLHGNVDDDEIVIRHSLHFFCHSFFTFTHSCLSNPGGGGGGPALLSVSITRTLYEQRTEQHKTLVATVLRRGCSKSSGGQKSLGWSSTHNHHSSE